MVAVLIGLGMGVVFGFALEKSRVCEPGMIVGQMQLRNFTMLKVFLTAIGTGAVVLAVLHGFGLVPLSPKPTLYGADLLGGALLGVGIVLAGACPGTVMAQVGVGYRDAIYTLIGGLLGAIAFSYAQPLLKPILLSGGQGKITYADVTGIPYWILALGMVAVFAAGLYALEKWRPWQQEMGSDDAGDVGGETSLGGHSHAPAATGAVSNMR
jgi:uncharacterized membrane protein YedE/YeeE